MNSETCAALTAVFPLITIALVLERRGLPERLRRHKQFRLWTEYATLASILGLALSVVGVQLRGLESGWAIVAWFLFGVSLLVFAAHLVLLLLNSEAEEDEALAE